MVKCLCHLNVLIAFVGCLMCMELSKSITWAYPSDVVESFDCN